MINIWNVCVCVAGLWWTVCHLLEDSMKQNPGTCLKNMIDIYHPASSHLAIKLVKVSVLYC